jgi:TolA-binding protein
VVGGCDDRPPPRGIIEAHWEAAMDQRSADTPEVLKFASRQNARDESPIDQVGHALVAAVAQAARVGEENVERAMTVAHKLSIQLRDAEDRISQLEAEINRLENRAIRAEQWLQTIKSEIENKLIRQLETNRPELPVLH